MVTWVHFFPLLNQNMFVQMLPLPKHNQTKIKKSPDVNITLPNCICIYSLAKKCIVCEHDTNLLNIDMTFWIGYINYMHFSVSKENVIQLQTHFQQKKIHLYRNVILRKKSPTKIYLLLLKPLSKNWMCQLLCLSRDLRGK